uniref:Tectonic-1-3 N-terminal domain-containing protein n=1 Tax=Timema tahoe TaxID=61484 RepID=A0A7R9IDC1_9NEOP|nr:unnamed protein product [Timema tahoe]
MYQIPTYHRVSARSVSQSSVQPYHTGRRYPLGWDTYRESLTCGENRNGVHFVYPERWQAYLDGIHYEAAYKTLNEYSRPQCVIGFQEESVIAGVGGLSFHTGPGASEVSPLGLSFSLREQFILALPVVVRRNDNTKTIASQTVHRHRENSTQLVAFVSMVTKTLSRAREDCIVILHNYSDRSTLGHVIANAAIKGTSFLCVVCDFHIHPINWSLATVKGSSPRERVYFHPAYSEVASSPCDLTENFCDISCCSDQDCFEDQKLSFTCSIKKQNTDAGNITEEEILPVSFSGNPGYEVSRPLVVVMNNSLENDTSTEWKQGMVGVWSKGYIIWSGNFSKPSALSCELSLSTKEAMGLLYTSCQSWSYCCDPHCSYASTSYRRTCAHRRHSPVSSPPRGADLGSSLTVKRRKRKPWLEKQTQSIGRVWFEKLQSDHVLQVSDALWFPVVAFTGGPNQ